MIKIFNNLENLSKSDKSNGFGGFGDFDISVRFDDNSRKDKSTCLFPSAVIDLLIPCFPTLPFVLPIF